MPPIASHLEASSPLQALAGWICGCDRSAVGVVGLGIKIGGELLLACCIVEKSKPAQVFFEEAQAGDLLDG